MPAYYVIEASYGPRVEETGLRHGILEAKNPETAIARTRNDFDTYGHERVEVFANEADYRAKIPPLAMWENKESLARVVRYPGVRRKFEAFFVTPLPQ
ncbi:MAG: hypothetical protein HY513_02890 [Candidatus Aenigmarchaeota archaeon]|nr:hypothetical protein [Candidatus Aenigmarchaeota archaeon]